MIRFAHYTLIFMFLAGCASSIATPFSTPELFDITRYCAQAGPENLPESLPENPASVMAKLDDETGKNSDDAVADALLTKAAMTIARSSKDAEECTHVMAKGEQIFLQMVEIQNKKWRAIGAFEPSKNPAILAVQTELTRLWREDQSARGTYISLKTAVKAGAKYWAQRLATAHATRTDGRSKQYMEKLLLNYDWIDKSRFGIDISSHAWILVQHADDHPEFQAEVLKRMEPYLENGGVKPANYAYLWDRVAVNTGRKQRYGTQPTWECTDGKLTLQPLEDPKNVNARRAKMGMGTVEQGLESMAQNVCR